MGFVNKKWLPFLLLALMALAIVLIRQFKKEESGKATNDPATVNRNRGFDRRTSYLEYTRHARCRMDCRQISMKEVEELMEAGKINYNKSDVKAKPCPTYALEGRTSDDQRVRIVYAQCDLKTKVVTVIDLDKEWECHCPGDEENRSGAKNRKP